MTADVIYAGGDIVTIDDARPSAEAAAELAKFRDQKHVPAGELIIGYGYDDTLMPDGRTLHKEHLDAVFPANPVLVGHVSMHGAVLNSAAMREYGISADTPTPPGGVIVRKDGSNDPEGLVMETRVAFEALLT